MRKIKSILAILLVVSFSFLISGCYGSFALTKKVYNWNGTMGDKFVKEAVFLGLNIIPVYGVAAFIDGIFLNAVEFWTGSNPMSLNKGENKIKFNGKDVTLFVSENQTIISDNQNNVQAVLTFNKYNNSWYITQNGQTTRLMTISNEQLTAYDTKGKTQVIEKQIVSDKN
jgi:hypothetical protein